MDDKWSCKRNHARTTLSMQGSAGQSEHEKLIAVIDTLTLPSTHNIAIARVQNPSATRKSAYSHAVVVRNVIDGQRGLGLFIVLGGCKSDCCAGTAQIWSRQYILQKHGQRVCPWSKEQEVS
jgi:hypothetical protein